jgi:predicted metal-binding protein
LTVLRDAEDGPAVVVCNTCRVSLEERETSDGLRGGALLAAALREAAAGTGVAVQEMPCLFNCGQHCSIHLRAPGKIGYVLGRFEPTAEAARAIIEYATAYAASDEGVVPYRQWPEGVKGHFIVRVPPAGKLVAD